jgi:hypothetical protein
MNFRIEKPHPGCATAPKRRGRPPRSKPPPPANPENDGSDDGMSPITSLDTGNFSDSFLTNVPIEVVLVSRPKPKTKAVAKKRAMTPSSDDDEGSEYEVRAPLRKRAKATTAATTTAKRKPLSTAQTTKGVSEFKSENVGDSNKGDHYGDGKNGDTVDNGKEKAMRHSIIGKKLLAATHRGLLLINIFRSYNVQSSTTKCSNEAP